MDERHVAVGLQLQAIEMTWQTLLTAYLPTCRLHRFSPANARTEPCQIPARWMLHKCLEMIPYPDSDDEVQTSGGTCFFRIRWRAGLNKRFGYSLAAAPGLTGLCATLLHNGKLEAMSYTRRCEPWDDIHFLCWTPARMRRL
jgi:hypothetical protein